MSACCTDDGQCGATADPSADPVMCTVEAPPPEEDDAGMEKGDTGGSGGGM